MSFKNSDSLKIAKTDFIDSVLDAKEVNSVLELSKDYSNKVYFWGRSFGIDGSWISSSVKIKSKKGLYMAASATYWSDIVIKSIIAEEDIYLGYKHTLFDLVDFETYYNHTFMNYGKKSSRKQFNNTWYSSAYIDINGIANFGIVSNYIWGTALVTSIEPIRDNVMITTFDLSKDFYVYQKLGAERICLNFQALADFGTDDFSLTRSRQVGKKIVGANAIMTQRPYGLMNVEIAANIQYRTKNLEFNISPRYSMPKNAITAEANNPVFYVTSGLVLYIGK